MIRQRRGWVIHGAGIKTTRRCDGCRGFNSGSDNGDVMKFLRRVLGFQCVQPLLSHSLECEEQRNAIDGELKRRHSSMALEARSAAKTSYLTRTLQESPSHVLQQHQIPTCKIGFTNLGGCFLLYHTAKAFFIFHRPHRPSPITTQQNKQSMSAQFA